MFDKTRPVRNPIVEGHTVLLRSKKPKVPSTLPLTREYVTFKKWGKLSG
jgi:hypothetical protein